MPLVYCVHAGQWPTIPRGIEACRFGNFNNPIVAIVFNLAVTLNVDKWWKVGDAPAVAPMAQDTVMFAIKDKSSRFLTDQPC